MKRYKVREIIKMLKEDGWYLDRQRGSHRQFRHTSKQGTVTVPGHENETMKQSTLNSIFKQAGWL